MSLFTIPKRIEVKFFERPFRLQIRFHLANQQFAVHEKDVGLDAAKSMIEPVQERSRMLVIVVRMALGSGLRETQRFGDAARTPRAR